MQFFLTVDRKSAVRLGAKSAGPCQVDIDLATLPQEDRDALAFCVDKDGILMDYNNRLTVESPDQEVVVAAARKIYTQRMKEVADQKARDENEIATVEEHDRETLRLKRTNVRQCAGWTELYPDTLFVSTWNNRAKDLVTRNSTEWKAWLAEIEEANQKARDEYDARKAAEVKAKELQQKTAIDRLKAWVASHGSELTKARLEEGFDGWVSSAHGDFADAVGEVVRRCNLVRSGDDVIQEMQDYKSEDRRSPTLTDIQALREVRSLLAASEFADCTSVSLVRTTYRDDDGEKQAITEIRVNVTYPDGVEGAWDYQLTAE